MESIKIQARIDTRTELTQEQVQQLNGKLSIVFEEFAQEIGNQQPIDIGWSWWKHMNLI